MSGKRRIWGGTDLDWQAEHERQMRARFMQVGEWRGTQQEPVTSPAYTRPGAITETTPAPVVIPALAGAAPRDETPLCVLATTHTEYTNPVDEYRVWKIERPQYTEFEQRLVALGLERVAPDTWVTKGGGSVTIAQYDSNVMFLAPVYTEQCELVEVLLERP